MYSVNKKITTIKYSDSKNRRIPIDNSNKELFERIFVDPDSRPCKKSRGSKPDSVNVYAIAQQNFQTMPQINTATIPVAKLKNYDGKQLSVNQIIEKIEIISKKYGFSRKDIDGIARKPFNECSYNKLNKLYEGLDKLVKSSPLKESVFNQAKAAGFETSQIITILRRSRAKLPQNIEVLQSFITDRPWQKSVLYTLQQAGFTTKQITSVLGDSGGQLQQAVDALTNLVTPTYSETPLLQQAQDAGFTLDQVVGMLMYSSGKLPISVEGIKDLLTSTSTRESICTRTKKLGFSVHDLANILYCAKGQLRTAVSVLDSFISNRQGGSSIAQGLIEVGLSHGKIVGILARSKGLIIEVAHILEKIELALHFSSDESKSNFLQDIPRRQKETVTFWIQRANMLLGSLDNATLKDVVLGDLEHAHPIEPEDITDDLLSSDNDDTDLDLSGFAW